MADKKLPPVQCAPWCAKGDGHTDEVFPEDQTCWGYERYVDLSLAGVMLDPQGVFYSGVGAFAHRSGATKQSVVYVHLRDVEVPGGDYLDSSIHLTAEEARQFAQLLVEAADAIQGA